MTSNRQILLSGVGLGVLVAVMAWLFIWPGYRDARAFRGEVDKYQGKIAGLKDNLRQVRVLAEQVEETRRMVSLKYKVIPPWPEVEELIRKLSLEVDEVSVKDQMFDVGIAQEIDVGVSTTIRAMPLKVEMSATFESIFALLRAAESMNQLMRVSSLKVICKREVTPASERTGGLEMSPVLNASVGLEAIYDPPPDADGYEEEGR